MRFVCDSCRAQYMISDDKVGPKGVKVRCKKCGHTILVRPAGEPAAKEAGTESASAKATTPANGTPRVADASAPGLPASLGTPPEGGLFTDVEEDEIGAVFDQVLSSGSHKIPAGESVGESAKDAASETVRKLAEAEETDASKDDGKAGATSHEWFVAIEEKQVGPWSVEKVKDAWDRGEVGPDSLCWRAGFSDWIPLSEASELASVLAPRPSKPVIVAPAPVSTSSPTIQAGPVESAFSAGSSRSGREGSLGGASPAPSDEPVGWKPSAASVLASLVKEENEALAKPPPRPAPSLEKEPVSQSRLLDVPVPPPEPVSSPGAPAGMMMAAAPVSHAPAPYAPPAPAYAQPAPSPYAQPAPGPYAQPAPGYPQPGYPTAYPPPAAPAASKGRTGLLVAAVAGVLVIAGAAVVYVARGGERTPEAPVQPPAQVAAAPTRPATELPMPPPPTGTVQTPPAAAQQPATAAVAATPPPATGTPVAAAGAPAAAGTVPAATGTTPPAAATTPPPAMGTPTPPANTGTAVAAAPTPPPPATPASTGTAVARVERRPVRSGSSGSRGGGDEAPTRTASSSSSSSGDDDFDELFGTKKPASAQKSETKAPTTYIPPEPGGSTPERLQQSDIMQVVLANKPAIVKCVSEQKKKDPALSGKLVMRWTIQTSGKTSSITCRTDEFRSSYMASCISGLIKGWTFPRHKKQGDPIDFPFTF